MLQKLFDLCHELISKQSLINWYNVYISHDGHTRYALYIILHMLNNALHEMKQPLCLRHEQLIDFEEET